jgi:hypothetical protein
MKPAERLEVPDTERLHQALCTAIDRLDPLVLIESGTYLGTGTTRALLHALGQRRPKRFVTLEVSKTLLQQAVANLADAPWIECVWGMSVRRRAAIEFVRQDPLLRDLDPDLDIYVDFLPNPVAGYLAELEGRLVGDSTESCPDGLLEHLLPLHAPDRPLVTLDSAGGIGFLEFQETLRLLGSHPFGLFLDDINHVKHYRSKLHIEADPAFSVIDTCPDEGWMVALANLPA